MITEVKELVEKLLTRNIFIREVNGELSIKAEKGVITKEILSEIRANKADLVAYLERHQSSSSSMSAIPKATRSEEGVFPLSHAQQRMWLIDNLDKNSNNTMPTALSVIGVFDLEIAECAIREIIARHESLRTSFFEQNGHPVQQVNESVEFSLSFHDFSHLTRIEAEKSLQGLVEKNRLKRFDLASGQVLSANYALIENTGDEVIGALLFNLHHIVSDGWSMG